MNADTTTRDIGIRKEKEYVSSINNQVPMQNLLQVKHQVSVKITSSHTKVSPSPLWSSSSTCC